MGASTVGRRKGVRETKGGVGARESPQRTIGRAGAREGFVGKPNGPRNVEEV